MAARAERDKLSSLLYWYPKLKAANIVPMPQTVIVETPTQTSWRNCTWQPTKLATRFFCAQTWSQASLTGRTHATSPSARPFSGFQRGLLCSASSSSWTMNSEHSGECLLRERRYFVKDGAVTCHHPYWRQEAIEKWLAPRRRMGIKTELPENWRELLAKINNEGAESEEVAYLIRTAERVGKLVGGYWSVDFAYVKEARSKPTLAPDNYLPNWYLIDMAQGVDSSHPSDCPVLPGELRAEMKAEEQ